MMRGDTEWIPEFFFHAAGRLDDGLIEVGVAPVDHDEDVEV